MGKKISHMGKRYDEQVVSGSAIIEKSNLPWEQEQCFVTTPSPTVRYVRCEFIAFIRKLQKTSLPLDAQTSRQHPKQSSKFTSAKEIMFLVQLVLFVSACKQDWAKLTDLNTIKLGGNV